MSGLPEVREVRTLRDRYGDEVELSADDGTSEEYRIVTEFDWDGREYAVLESEALRREGEIAVFRIDKSGPEPQLEQIEDDDEWETVAEIADDLLF
ncbi:MAG: hypothetical protein BLM47_04565 [Candidatus Reconcilbacillus cellulovorans]|uniref:DUF1292 domain-containing protein n=1 Tax=Candidatus Reconcilbacillus cellulovorans TaxID=1906605 RepID=A0A2A6E2B2_9BACL|nr:MAG: hypothetical protein BLM47_04565 [Candidatus Reconcilbacillus cellulovorans]